jgi:uncharacterized protein (DUF952 family)
MTHKYIYLLSSSDDYQAALKEGHLQRDSLETEGFIHASPKDQLTRVANKYYKQVKKPLVLVVAVDKITPEVKWEPAAGSLYPHIYGALNMDAVVNALPTSLQDNGDFSIEID